MFALSFLFPAGRYHATPWGRHVNEADVAWPPEPWRILRALIATWHLKGDQAQFPENVLASLIDHLSVELPAYRLPAATHAHSRHYMPWFKKGPGDKTLVFDAFARLAPDDPLIVCWRTVTLTDREHALAEHLAERLGYLGRAESWVVARCLDHVDVGELTCIPVADRDGEIGDNEPVTVLAPLTPAAWTTAQAALASDAASLSKTKKLKRLSVLGATLLDVLGTDTADWQAEGFSRPPGSRAVIYACPPDALAQPTVQKRPAIPQPSFTTVRYVISGRPQPLLTDAVRLGECLRKALMSMAKTSLGEQNVPWQLSGHGRSGAHDHAFFLPEDTDGAGRITHLTVHAAAGFPNDLRSVFGRLNRLFAGARGDWKVALDAIGTAPELLPGGATWISRTPYLHPWHRKAGFGAEEQLRKEIALRGLPAPVSVAFRETISANGKDLTPIRFHRFRSKKGLVQPDTHGGFWEIVFPEPVHGPLALGFGAHFGLGQFVPVGRRMMP